MLDKMSNITIVEVVRAWKHHDFVCKNYILNLLENTLYDVYNSIDNAKALWESLDQKYKAKDVDLTKLLVCKFVEFKMVDVRIIISQVQDFKLIPHGIYIEEMVTNEYF